MRVGIFGGTFDPPHMGHLILAELARESARLDEVWFLPAPRPPQKEGQAVTRFDQRVEMLQLAVAGNPSFRIDEIEKERTGPSYTADTLAQLRQRHPGHTFFLLLGGDSLSDLPLWYQPKRIVEQAGLVVMERPGTAHPTAEQLRQSLALPPDAQLSLQFVPAPQIDIASRSLRKAVAEGRSVRYQVPSAVEAYIRQHHLYREGGQ
jgi:nicotinate-nucleotide adenylyltransferase